jgi:hypothetical protein
MSIKYKKIMPILNINLHLTLKKYKWIILVAKKKTLIKNYIINDQIIGI